MPPPIFAYHQIGAFISPNDARLVRTKNNAAAVRNDLNALSRRSGSELVSLSSFAAFQFGLYSWPMVKTYMQHVMDNAEESVRRVIDRIGDGSFSYVMDDGASLQVRISMNHAARTAKVDFTGTAPQRHNNFNAPPSVTKAAVLYTFR